MLAGQTHVSSSPNLAQPPSAADTVTILDPKEDKPLITAPQKGDEKAYQAGPPMGGRPMQTAY